ncbi:MAG: DUF1080 domain-containing protein [Planctomycetes bacterium]|nr:DUF1080 domain-containing protein [Planctomycetota bacterium]
MKEFLIAVTFCGLAANLPAVRAAVAGNAGQRATSTQPAADNKPPKGFVALFDGKTLKGWTGRPTLWKVQDGAILGQTTPKTAIKHNQFLYTNKQYGNFELRLRFKLINHNSGVQIRSTVHEDYRVTGYQADMAEKRYTGILYEEGGRGILADVDPKKVAPHVHQGDWNDYRIVCEGPHIRLWINGYQTVDYTEKSKKAPKKGVIGLQLHHGQPMKVFFKNIYIRPLP